MMYWNGNGGMSAWGWTLMTVGMVVFWGLLIAAAIVLYRYLSDRPWNAPMPQPPTFDGPAAHRAPAEILAERFARGEIDENEYRDRLATLHGAVRS